MVKEAPVDVIGVEYDMTLGGAVFGEGISLDLNLPGIDFDIDGKLIPKLDWSFDFGFGLSTTHGFYLSTNPGSDPELIVEIGAFLEGDGDAALYRERETRTDGLGSHG